MHLVHSQYYWLWTRRNGCALIQHTKSLMYQKPARMFSLPLRAICTTAYMKFGQKNHWLTDNCHKSINFAHFILETPSCAPDFWTLQPIIHQGLSQYKFLILMSFKKYKIYIRLLAFLHFSQKHKLFVWDISTKTFGLNLPIKINKFLRKQSRRRKIRIHKQIKVTQQLLAWSSFTRRFTKGQFF